jgi:hypothetical protein
MFVFRAATGALAGVVIYAGGAVACPNLSGTYLCPAWQVQPPTQLGVTSVLRADGSASYEFRYGTGASQTIRKFEASPAGILDANAHTRMCVGQSLLNKGPNEVGEGTKNVLNAAGDYQAFYNGQLQITCPRQRR